MKSIIKKYLENKANSKEQSDLLNWLRQNDARHDFLKYKSEWKKSLDESWFPEDGRKSWNEIQAAMLQNNFFELRAAHRKQTILKYAAILLVAIMSSGLIWYFVSGTGGKPVYYTKIIAEKGHISKVELPDGSSVWLNSGSEMRYDNFFADGNRNISFTGEAYFEIKRDEKIPLVVSCNNLKIKVLGTKFNVASYPGEGSVDVVLEKGSVELSSNESASFNYRMKPGERARFETTNHKLHISRVNTTKFTSWKDGIINIYNQSLPEVIKRLEVRYNQHFDFEENTMNFHYTFTIKNEPLSDIIQLMEKITPVKAVQKGDIITFRMDKTKMRKVDNR